MTTSGTPLVRVEIETDPHVAEMWEAARQIDPMGMARAFLVRTLPLPNGQVRVVLALEPQQYAFCFLAGKGDAANFLQILLSSDAADILHPVPF
ncbi:MAG: hypothetical protein JNN24_07440 [Hyphomicrobium zavarzinii]|uniref:hypothetical protein n=1 Tax=Hyphomicrobium zavarzinii TaxID=48292 RepID=UPI001A5A46D5|nr:hypothetical protein [Hyphomicrobium zavarzinii]MBL8845588.1 hypothetical protein [Hyphomicrobium zavarzinii]